MALTASSVERLRGSIKIDHTLAEHGANRLWDLLHSEDYIGALGAVTGNQAMQMVRLAAGAFLAKNRSLRVTATSSPLLGAFGVFPLAAATTTTAAATAVVAATATVIDGDTDGRACRLLPGGVPRRGGQLTGAVWGLSAVPAEQPALACSP